MLVGIRGRNSLWSWHLLDALQVYNMQVWPKKVTSSLYGLHDAISHMLTTWSPPGVHSRRGGGGGGGGRGEGGGGVTNEHTVEPPPLLEQRRDVINLACMRGESSHAVQETSGTCNIHCKSRARAIVLLMNDIGAAPMTCDSALL